MRAGGWARNAFVVAEIALAVGLVASAGLLARSLATLVSVDMGFKPDRLLVADTQFPVRVLRRCAARHRLLPRSAGRLRALPGVEAAAGVTSLPTAMRSNGSFVIEGSTPLLPAGVRSPQSHFQRRDARVLPDPAVPFTRGRDFSDADTRTRRLSRLSTRRWSARCSAPTDPIGRRIQCGLDSREFMTIVGVVADVRTTGPGSPRSRKSIMPYEQHPGPATSLNLVVRAESIEPLALADTIRRTIAARNPDVPVKASTMEARLEVATVLPRFRTFLVVAFAGVALLLALAGVYGVMAYTVSQRIPELGVRIALGATPENIMGWSSGKGQSWRSPAWCWESACRCCRRGCSKDCCSA